jgi:hypothetical protein
MAKSSEEVAALAAEQLATIRDAVVRDALGSLLQTPSPHLRDWDYGVEGEVHWYERHGLGRRELKIKCLLGDPS